MDCPVCKSRMNRVGLDSLSPGGVLAEFECPQCHARIRAPVKPEN